MSDLISRCALFNRLATVQTLGEAYGVIQGMETVDAVPVVHGRWVADPEDDGVCCCSECGRYEFYQSDFCPNCGADMRKDGEQHGTK